MGITSPSTPRVLLVQSGRLHEKTKVSVEARHDWMSAEG